MLLLNATAGEFALLSVFEYVGVFAPTGLL